MQHYGSLSSVSVFLLLFFVVIVGPWIANSSPETVRSEVDGVIGVLQKDYLTKLGQLLQSYQNSGELDAYLAVQGEIERAKTNPLLSEIQQSPHVLPMRWIQETTLDSYHHQIYQIASKQLLLMAPEVVRLTKEGKIQEALSVRQAMDAIRNKYKTSFDIHEPITPGSSVDSVDSAVLAEFCSSNEALALQALLGKTFRLSGKIVDCHQDFSNSTILHVKLNQGSGSLPITLRFHGPDAKWKQIKSKDETTYMINATPHFAPNGVLIGKGRTLEATGTLKSLHLMVTLDFVSFPKESSFNELIDPPKTD